MKNKVLRFFTALFISIHFVFSTFAYSEIQPIFELTSCCENNQKDSCCDNSNKESSCNNHCCGSNSTFSLDRTVVLSQHEVSRQIKVVENQPIITYTINTTYDIVKNVISNYTVDFSLFHTYLRVFICIWRC